MLEQYLEDENYPVKSKKDLTVILKENRNLLDEENLYEIYRQHIRDTMNAMEVITGHANQDICSSIEWIKSPFKDIHDFWLGLSNIEKQFLRFVALYHDIGKVIYRDRHPILGKHLLESLSEDETRNLTEILGEGNFLKMTHLVAYHDLFGVLCTGEASRPVLIDAAGLTVNAKTIGYYQPCGYMWNSR
jgi:metal-dependent HD superfamily phosphatase/phosphodiesterase